MTAWSTVLEALADEGWTESFTGTLTEALDRKVASYGGLAPIAPRSRQVSGWADHPNVTVTAWVPDPAHVDLHDRGTTLVVAFADGRPTRKLTWDSGSTVWVDPPNGSLVDLVRRSGKTGATTRATWLAERSAESARQAAANARQAALINDLSDLCAEAGVDLRPGAMPGGQVAVDLEVLLSVMRSVNDRG
jgi:hypothetical protein